MKLTIFTLLLSLLFMSAASGQGLLGKRYGGLGVGFERLDLPDDSLEGASVVGEINFPLSNPRARSGFDVNLKASYSHFSEDDFDINGAVVDGLFRGYRPLSKTSRAYLGAGMSWNYWELSTFAFRATDSTLGLPVEGGLEFNMGRFSLRPFYRYTFATESGYDDFWSVGATASTWISRNWGLQAGVTRTDFGDDFESLSVRGGVILSF